MLAEVSLGRMIAQAVRTRTSDEVRAALKTNGVIVEDEIIEVRVGDDAGQPVISERPARIIIDEQHVLLFGLLPVNAVGVEVVAPDGGRVSCEIGDGVWLAVVPHNRRGAESYPVLFRDDRGAPVNPGLPSDWEREEIGRRDTECPACGENTWDLVTAAWQGIGPLRNTRWGNINGVEPGRAFVCRTCGHEVKIGAPIRHRRF